MENDDGDGDEGECSWKYGYVCITYRVTHGAYILRTF